MANYSDFLRITNRDGLRRLYYVSGEEIVLREMVLARIKRDLGLGPGSATTIYLDDTPEDAAWLSADSYGLDDDSPRLVVFRNAQLLTDFDRLLHWADYRGAGAVLRHVTLVLMAEADDWPTTLNHKGEHVYHRADVRDALTKWRSCMLVTCKVKSTKAAGEAVADWLNCPSEPGTPEWLYTWLGGDLAACRDAAQAIAPFRMFLDRAGKRYRVLDLLQAYVKPSPRSEFIHSLESFDKVKAIEAASQVPRNQLRGTISWVAADLEVLTRVRRVQMPGLGNQEVANRLRLHRLRVDTLRPYARYYDSNKSFHCSQVLAQAESMMKEGADEGVLEMVTALW